MVSKVAVIALVAIVACPILLGYGMNLEQVTHTDYKPSDDSINVSSLLKTGEQYNTANADINRLNTNFVGSYDNQEPFVPLYERKTPDKTSLPFNVDYTANYTGGTWSLTGKLRTYLQFNYTQTSSNYVTIQIYGNNTSTINIDRATYFYYDSTTDSITYYNYANAYMPAPDPHFITGGQYTTVTMVLHGLSSVGMNWGIQATSGNNANYFVDIASGFRIQDSSARGYIKLPGYTKSYLMTINLNSVSDSNYPMVIADDFSTFRLTKTTNNGVVTWKCSGNDGDQTIYFDTSRTDNTYQYSTELVEKYELNGRVYSKVHCELRYVGSWPTVMGEAAPYLVYEYESLSSRPINIGDPTGFNMIQVYRSDGVHGKTPILRMDGAKFSAFMYPIISNKLYDPAGFKTNPSTKLVDIGKFGSYLTFGNIRYDVKDGNITLGNHQVSVKNITLDSIPTAGGYSNRINGIVISTSGTPSTITFGGEWGCSVVTTAMESTTYTSTDWTPGQFAWNGLDQNFLMIGLLAALGVFIALGIAYRKVKSALFALLVVCGGAAVLFFTMI